MSYGDKIKSIRKLNRLTQAEFAHKIGVSRHTIMNWESDETAPSESEMSGIVKIFNNEVKNVERDTTPIRIVDVRAQAGYMRGYNDPEYVESLPTISVNEQFERGGYYMAFVVNGDSMDDGSSKSLLHSDVVLGKELQKHHWKSKIHVNQYPFIIVSKEGVVFKDIISHDVEKGLITLHSRNPLYDDYQVNLKEVYQIFYVVQLVERKLKM